MSTNISRQQTSAHVLFFFLLTLIPLQAQKTDATPIVQALNQRIAGVEKGMFTVDARFKFADEEDTIAHRGTCYFFRKSNSDSMAQFVVVSEGKPLYAFDGERFFQNWGDDKFKVSTTKNVKRGLKRLLGGNVKKSNLVYEPLLRVDRPNFRPSSFDTVELSALQLDNAGPVLRLTLRDTSVEEALGNVANNKIISVYHWDISLPDYQLIRLTGSVWLFDGWQYEEKRFSPITPLPASAQFSDYFDPEKLAATYVFEDYDPDAPPKRDRELIQADAAMPDFTLTDLNGKTYALSDQHTGVLLLDFWYKGCFPCQLAMPKLESLHQKYAAQGLQVLGVNPFDKNTDSLKEWLKGRQITYNTLFDPERKLPNAVGIEGYPLLLLVDAKTKKVLHVHTGYSETMEAELAPVIVSQLEK